MKSLSISLLALTLLAGLALAAPDSLACRTIDWLDVTGATMRYGSDGIDGDGDYEYSGTWLWDMAMGDSFLVWLPGTDWFYFINPFSQTDVETLAGFDYGSVGAKGITVKDSISYIVGGGGVNTTQYRNDSLLVIGGLWIPGASFHYAVIRDTFLYTASTGSYGLHCINIANPESIFVAWTNGYYIGFSGLEVVDSVVYSASASTFHVSPPDDWHSRPHWYLLMADVSGDTCVVHTRIEYSDNEHHCSIASNNENLFYAFTEMTDFIAGAQDYSLGNSNLGIWGTDYSYTWTDYDSEGVFGVEVLNEYILAVGFEHGFSILDYSDLDDIHEVAYYRDTDSVFAFTHFALKDNRMFAMAHPRTDTCRLYMFELDESVISGIEEEFPPQTALPEAFEISAHPNPFNSAVTITIDGVGAGFTPACVEIYDVNGRRVAEIIPPDPPLTRGEEERKSPLLRGDLGGLVWRPDESLPSGVYLVRARSAGKEGFDKLSDRDGRGDLDPDAPSTRGVIKSGSGTVVTARVVYLK